MNCSKVATRKETNRNDCAYVNLRNVDAKKNTHRIFNAAKTTFYVHCDIIQNQFGKEEVT